MLVRSKTSRLTKGNDQLAFHIAVEPAEHEAHRKQIRLNSLYVRFRDRSTTASSVKNMT